MKNFLFILFIIVSNFIVAQKHLKNADGESIAYIKENILLDNNHQVLYNYKGFIVFNKTSNNKNDIVLTMDVRKNKTIVFNKVETSPTWVLRKENIIWKHDRENIDIINIKKQEGFTSFYNIHNDSLLGFIDTENISDLELSLAFFHLWNVLNLEELFVKQQEESIFTQNSDIPEGILGIMKPVFGDEMNVWLWDGQYFYPAYNNDQRFVWEFDGETLKPIWNSKIENEWSWDGDELKPFWGGHPRNNWRWENGIFKQIFESNYKNEFEIVDNVVRKRFGSFGDKEWEIEGNVPLPVLSIILLGIVYR